MKKSKILLCLMLVLVMAFSSFALIACDKTSNDASTEDTTTPEETTPEDTTTEDTTTEDEVELDPDIAISFGYDSNIADIAAGASVALLPTVEITDIADADYTFTTSSSDTSIATVDADGVITGVSKGIAIITVTSTQTVSTMTWVDGAVGYADIPATENIVVVVDNEYNTATYADLAGTYRTSIEWQGTASSASTEVGTIIAEIVVTIAEDGTFYHNIANAQRATYDAETSAYMYPFNAQLQESSVLGSAYIDVAQSSMTHISQTGCFAIIDGDLYLILLSPTGSTSIMNYGAIAEWTTDFTAMSDMVAINEAMTGDLVKDPTFAEVAGTYSYTGTNDSVTTAVLNADGTFTFTYKTETVASGDYYIVGDYVYLPYSNDADGEGEMELLWNEAGSLYGKVVIGYGFSFTWTLKTADYVAPNTDSDSNDDSALSSEALAYVGAYDSVETYNSNGYVLTLNDDATFTYVRLSDNTYMKGTWAYANGNITLTPTDTFKSTGDSTALYLDSTFVLTVSVDADGAISLQVTAGYEGDYGMPAIFSMAMSTGDNADKYYPIYNFTASSDEAN